MTLSIILFYISETFIAPLFLVELRRLCVKLRYGHT